MKLYSDAHSFIADTYYGAFGGDEVTVTLFARNILEAIENSFSTQPFGMDSDINMLEIRYGKKNNSKV